MSDNSRYVALKAQRLATSLPTHAGLYSVNKHLIMEGGSKYENFSLPDLRDELRKRGAKVPGRKAELVSRFVYRL